MYPSTSVHNTLFERALNSPRLFREGQLRADVIVIASILLSVVIIAFRPTVNKDGILYLLTAIEFLEGGFSQVFEAYYWPFYSIAIALLHQLTAIPLHYSGYVVTSVCFAIISYAFVQIVMMMGGSRRVQLFALLVVLFQPIIGDYRASIMRDPGFIAFMLLALLELIRYSKNPSLKSQLVWLCYVVIAFLFRPEMLPIAIAAPLGLLFFYDGVIKERIKVAFKFSSVPLLLCTVLGGLVFISFPEILDNAKPVADINRYSSEFSGLHYRVSTASDVIAEKILTYTAREDSIFAAYAVFITILAVNIFRALTPVYALILLVCWLKRVALPTDRFSHRLIQIHAIIILFYLMIFTISNQFMLERYCFQVVLLYMLFLPFCIDYLLSRFDNKRFVWFPVCLMFTLYALDTAINSDYKKTYIADAAQWIKNSEEAGTPLITNRPHIAYFSQPKDRRSEGVTMMNKELLLGQWLDDHLYAVNVKANMEEVVRFVLVVKKAEIIQEIANKKGDRVFIFKAGKRPSDDKT